MVQIPELGFGFSEALHLEEAFSDEFGDAVVGFAQADPHALGDLALAEIGFLSQDLKEALADILFQGLVHGANV